MKSGYFLLFFLLCLLQVRLYGQKNKVHRPVHFSTSQEFDTGIFLFSNPCLESTKNETGPKNVVRHFLEKGGTLEEFITKWKKDLKPQDEILNEDVRKKLGGINQYEIIYVQRDKKIAEQVYYDDAFFLIPKKMIPGMIPNSMINMYAIHKLRNIPISNLKKEFYDNHMDSLHKFNGAGYLLPEIVSDEEFKSGLIQNIRFKSNIYYVKKAVMLPDSLLPEITEKFVSLKVNEILESFRIIRDSNLLFRYHRLNNTINFPANIHGVFDAFMNTLKTEFSKAPKTMPADSLLYLIGGLITNNNSLEDYYYTFFYRTYNKDFNTLSAKEKKEFWEQRRLLAMPYINNPFSYEELDQEYRTKLHEVKSYCVSGDCKDGKGKVEYTVNFLSGPKKYSLEGSFKNGVLHGRGKAETSDPLETRINDGWFTEGHFITTAEFGGIDGEGKVYVKVNGSTCRFYPVIVKDTTKIFGISIYVTDYYRFSDAIAGSVYGGYPVKSINWSGSCSNGLLSGEGVLSVEKRLISGLWESEKTIYHGSFIKGKYETGKLYQGITFGAMKSDTQGDWYRIVFNFENGKFTRITHSK